MEEEKIEIEKEEKQEKENKKEKKQKRKDKKEDNIVKLTKEEIDAMNLKLKESEDKALRSQAELINYRKRKDEEVAKMLKYANEDIIAEILSTLDNFERALKMETSSEEIKKFLDGMKMIYQGLINTLEKFELKEIDAKGKSFDPAYHQAVIAEEAEGVDANIILEVLQKGYMLKDKVIRPAMVKVSK